MLEMFFSSRTSSPLRDLREQANITQAEIAKMTGLSRTKISMFENGFAPLTAPEEKKFKEAIVALTNERQRVVLKEARK